MDEKVKVAAIILTPIAMLMLGIGGAMFGEHQSSDAEFRAREQVMDCEGQAHHETVIVYQVERLVLTTFVHDTFIRTPPAWGDNHPLFKTPHPYTNFFEWLRDQTNAWPVDYTVECNEDVKDAQPRINVRTLD